MIEAMREACSRGFTEHDRSASRVHVGLPIHLQADHPPDAVSVARPETCQTGRGPVGLQAVAPPGVYERRTTAW